jgi:hypothetical protein
MLILDLLTGGGHVLGHVGGCTLGSRDPDGVTCSCPQGVHAITGRTPADTIRAVSGHCGWQGDPDRLAALAAAADDVRPALADLLTR